jgi:hypothetical protein
MESDTILLSPPIKKNYILNESVLENSGSAGQVITID